MITHSESISVVIVDDHRMFAECLGRLLDDTEGIRVVGTASTGAEAFAVVAEHHPLVALIDYGMPDHDGVWTASELKRRHPGVATVILCDDEDPEAAFAAINAGCSGFLAKSASAAEVAAAVRTIAAGEAHISSTLLLRLFRSKTETIDSATELTGRERETLHYLAKGWTSKVIAAEMGVTTSAIRNTVQSILNKLGVHSKLEAVTVAVQRGMLTYPVS